MSDLAAPIPLPGMLDFLAAASLHELMLEARRAGRCTIDGRQVERVSTACLQVLAASFGAMRQAGQAPCILAPSPVLSEAIHELGLAPLLLPQGE